MQMVATAGLARRSLRTTVAIAAGLAVGVGGAVWLWADRGGHGFKPIPSVAQLHLPAASATAAPPASADHPAPAAPAVEPRDARAAVTAFLAAGRDGDAVAAYALTDAATHARFSTIGQWRSTAADRPRPTTFTVGAARQHGQAVDVDVEVTQPAELDPFVGLVPAHASAVWSARLEDGHWRVAAAPSEVDPILPADASATPVVQSWLDRLAACDTAGARPSQAADYLYGPVGFYERPCRQHLQLHAGPARPLDASIDDATLVAAFGPDVRGWARAVPVEGPDHFLAAVAPLGDGWRVIGVMNDGEGGGGR